MYNPAHPGEILKELYIEPLDLSITEAAAALGITRKTLSSLLNCRSGISIAMAIRLAKAFDTTVESWLDMQQKYDIWINKNLYNNINVKSLVMSNSSLCIGTNEAKDS